MVRAKWFRLFRANVSTRSHLIDLDTRWVTIRTRGSGFTRWDDCGASEGLALCLLVPRPLNLENSSVCNGHLECVQTPISWPPSLSTDILLMSARNSHSASPLRPFHPLLSTTKTADTTQPGSSELAIAPGRGGNCAQAGVPEEEKEDNECHCRPIKRYFFKCLTSEQKCSGLTILCATRTEVFHKTHFSPAMNNCMLEFVCGFCGIKNNCLPYSYSSTGARLVCSFSD
jgi:hypothetical protein